MKAKDDLFPLTPPGTRPCPSPPRSHGGPRGRLRLQLCLEAPGEKSHQRPSASTLDLGDPRVTEWDGSESWSPEAGRGRGRGARSGHLLASPASPGQETTVPASVCRDIQGGTERILPGFPQLGPHSPVAHVLAGGPPVAVAPVVLTHGVPGLPLGGVHLEDEVRAVEANCGRGEAL